VSGSAGFALDVVACAALGLMLWAACAGIGFRILPGSPALRADDEPASWRQPGIAACVGLGALMMLGGIAVVVRIPWWAVVVPFVVVGLALVVGELRGLDFRRGTKQRMLIAGLAVAAVGVVAVTEAIAGLRFPLSPWDDLRAYLPMAHRLIDTNGLEDAWNARRLQNLGGFTFLQAPPVAIFGHAGLGVIETMLASIFLAGLFVANGLRSTWARVLSVVLILAIPLLWVPRINTTGVLMGTPLSVAVLAVTLELRRALRAKERRAAFQWAAGGGVVIAALMSVRPNLALLAALVFALGTFGATGTRLVARAQAIAVGGASTLAAMAPWSIASWQTVRTPFFLVYSGNQNREAVRLPPARDFADLVDHASGLLRAGPYLWIAVGALVIAMAARKLLPDPPLVAIAAAVTAAGIVGFALLGYTMSSPAFVRYVSPMSQGLAVFVLCETIRGADARSRAGVARAPGRGIQIAAVASASCIAAIGFSALGVKYLTVPGGVSLIDQAVRDELLPGSGYEVTTPALLSAYRRALARVDPEQTIAAVDRPYLIDYRRYDIPNMDLPGFTAPGGKFPFFTGPAAKVARLRRAGYHTLLATVPDNEIALNPYFLRITRRVGYTPYSTPARYYLDWADDIAAIWEEAPDAVRQFGPLLVIDLDQAQRELGTASGPG
jgi:hypothetical protein